MSNFMENTLLNMLKAIPQEKRQERFQTFKKALEEAKKTAATKPKNDKQ